MSDQIADREDADAEDLLINAADEAQAIGVDPDDAEIGTGELDDGAEDILDADTYEDPA